MKPDISLATKTGQFNLLPTGKRRGKRRDCCYFSPDGNQVAFAPGELRKNGLKVSLQGQPFQVCAFLLQRSGELVTREELRRKMWPEDTFVDFDHARITAITKIRAALGDEADNPRFV